MIERVVEPVINGYVLAGYSLIWATLAWYAWRTERRVRIAERRLEELDSEREREGSP